MESLKVFFTRKNIFKSVLLLSILLPLTTQAFISFPDKIDTQQERINIQVVLNTVMTSSPNLIIDGVLGRKSIQAVQAFQEVNGLVADGKIGPITRIALEKAQTNTSSSSECAPGALFSIITGKPCTSTVSTLPLGCTSTTLFSLVTGVSCGTKPMITSSTIPTTPMPFNFPITTPKCINRVCPKLVILVIEKFLNDDLEVKSKIERYKQDNPEYQFVDILFEKSNSPITTFEDTGGLIKNNSLELRNTIKQIYSQNPNNLEGVFIIGNIHPTIFRDSQLWRDLGSSGFYPSVYPLVALDKEHYERFDVANDGFYEKAGETFGSEVGGGYNASIWGAVLIPPTFDSTESKSLIINYFDRNHDYRIGNINYGKRLLYSHADGCSSEIYKRINATSLSTDDAMMLCPNFNSELGGFDSVYAFMIHNLGSNYAPGEREGINGMLAETPEEQTEFSEWKNKTYFSNSKPLITMNGDNSYTFNLILRDRSVSVDEIKQTIINNLPRTICSYNSCNVYVKEYGFAEKDGNWNGMWSTYPTQRDKWTELYKNELTNNNFLITYISTHGATTYHQFGIDSNTVKNAKFDSMIYEIESCNTGNYLVENYLAGTYLFYTNSLIASSYSIPFVMRGEEGYYENDESLSFLKLKPNEPIINALFLTNYSNSIYIGDPLLEMPI